MDRLPHSPPLMTYPAHSDYTPSPTHATFGFSTPLNTSYQLSHHAMLQQLGMHSYSHIYGLQTPYSPNNRPLVVANRPYRAVPEHVPKSALLEDFRLNKVRKKWELEVSFPDRVCVEDDGLQDVNGYIVEFCGDQHGSRFIQHRIETCTTDERQQVFDEIMPNAYQLMTDVFGNYVIQKLFEHGNQRQKAALAKKMENHVLPLSMQMYGCRVSQFLASGADWRQVVQKALEHVLLPQREILIRELEPHILNCVKSSNANHVIQVKKGRHYCTVDSLIPLLSV